MEKKRIAIVAGGDSSEIVVSVKSAQGIYSFIDKDKYEVYVVTIKKDQWSVEVEKDIHIQIDKNDFSFTSEGIKRMFDFAYITIHGTPGENGLLQGYFEMISMPYSTCGVLASALTFSKFTCNRYLETFGYKIAKSLLFRKDDIYSAEQIVSTLGLPCFVKPNVGGSSFGTTKVKEQWQLKEAIDAAFREGGEVIVEAFMQGTEITCGCYKSATGTHVLPVTEVVSKNEFFDFEAKYTASKVEEITPARISDDMTARVQQMTARIYSILGCKGIIRVDYIIVDDVPCLLEVNTTPGMTTTSFIPQQVKASGRVMGEVISEIIELELKN